MTPSCAFYRHNRWFWGYHPALHLTLPVAQLERLPELLKTHRASLACGVLPYDLGVATHGLSQACPEIDLLLFQDLESGTLLPPPTEPFNLESDFSPRQSERDYQRAFARIQQYLKAGDCYQVNYAQAFAARFSGSPYAGWWRLMQQHAAPHSCYFSGSQHTLLSASPERFLAIKGRSIQSEPIKGSRPRGRNGVEDARLSRELKNSAKDRAENLMIVDLLRNDIGKISEPGSISAAPLFELKQFSNVQHLVSRISGQLRPDVSAIEALLACFPGGSITGAPKRRSMEIIQELEQTARRCYCGSFFTLDRDGELDSNILIRTFQAQGDHLSIHGGGAITIASDCLEEYQESRFKVDKLMATLTSATRAA